MTLLLLCMARQMFMDYKPCRMLPVIYELSHAKMANKEILMKLLRGEQFEIQRGPEKSAIVSFEHTVQCKDVDWPRCLTFALMSPATHRVFRVEFDKMLSLEQKRKWAEMAGDVVGQLVKRIETEIELVASPSGQPRPRVHYRIEYVGLPQERTATLSKCCSWTTLVEEASSMEKRDATEACPCSLSDLSDARSN